MGCRSIHKTSSKLRPNSCTKVCSLSFCCISGSKRKTRSWYWLVLYRHSCDVATNLTPRNPDSSFPIGNKLYGFKRHTSIQACLQGPHNNWSWPTQRSKWPVKASKGVTHTLLTDKAPNISKTSPEENTNHSSNSRSHLGNIMMVCGYPWKWSVAEKHQSECRYKLHRNLHGNQTNISVRNHNKQARKIAATLDINQTISFITDDSDLAAIATP